MDFLVMEDLDVIYSVIQEGHEEDVQNIPSHSSLIEPLESLSVLRALRYGIYFLQKLDNPDRLLMV